MSVYISGLGNISPQHTGDGEDFFNDPVFSHENRLGCIEPVYKQYIKPMQLRRMSRILKMGTISALQCLQDAAVEMPGAIITGTGLGCIKDTEKFLTAVIENGEELLTPTSFIQSTHNTISAQIALQLKCSNYNYAYVHRGFSFESALLDGMMLLNEGEADTVLAGGVDEITDDSFTITERLGHWKQGAVDSSNLFEGQIGGSIAGEGSSFFLLTKGKNEHTYGELKGVSMLYKPESHEEVEIKLKAFLQRLGMTIADIDLVVLGKNGDYGSDAVYRYMEEGCFAGIDTACFKHLCGEYHTASSFALWLVASILKRKEVPAAVATGDVSGKAPKNILIYNHYRNKNHTFTVVSAC